MDKIEKYVRDKYPKKFKNKPVLVKETNGIYFVSTHKDESPIILNKKTLDELWMLKNLYKTKTKCLIEVL